MTPELVAASGAVVATLTALVVFQVFVLRWRLLARTRRIERATALWQPLLVQAVDAVPASLPALRRGDRRTFLTLWNHLQASVLDEAKDRLNEVAERLGLPSIARRMLDRGNLRDRLVAIATLGQLRDRAVWGRLCALAAGPHTVLSLAAARAIVEIDRARGIERLLPLIVTRLDWPPARVVRLLEAAGPDVISVPFAQAVIDAPPDRAARLVRFLEVAHSEVAIPTVRRLLESTDDPDVVAACLRLVRDPEDAPVVRQFLDHPRWEVRVRAVSALARIGAPGDEPALVRLLADQAWWVRQRAAQALCTLLAGSPERLDRIAATHRNPFARDALAQARAEGALR